MPQPLAIWCNVKFPPRIMERVRRDIGDATLIEAAATHASNLTVGGADPLLDDADIAWGQPDPQQVMRLGRLKWLQLTTAGYTRYDTSEFRAAAKRNGTIVCNCSTVYAEPCAQHLLSMMLALARRIPQSRDNQIEKCGWPILQLRAESVLLNGQTVLLVGYGAIARRLAELLAALHMNLIGFKRRPTADEPIRVESIDALDAHLPAADHVINTLPSSPQTDGFFNAARFARMRKGARYYNIGRGQTNDEAALQAALESHHLGAAYIDATITEPLPPDHPLWRTPNCFITPHTAGGHSTELDRHADLFLENLRRLRGGEELIDRIM